MSRDYIAEATEWYDTIKTNELRPYFDGKTGKKMQGTFGEYIAHIYRNEERGALFARAKKITERARDLVFKETDSLDAVREIRWQDVKARVFDGN